MDYKEKIQLSIKIFFLYGVAYGMTNHIDFFPSIPAPKVDFDQYFAFSPHWIWVYLSEALFVPFAFFLMKDQEQIKNFASSFILLTILANIIFFAYPTHIERDLFPNPGQEGTLLYYAFDILRVVDSPKNCFPSLHVASSFLIAFYLGLKNSRLGQFAFYYSILVALSTFYTKQHRIMDAMSGFFLALFCFVIVEKMIPRLLQLKKQYINN
jgi:membrane-associated phospholipid phosphatase